jgi:YhcH/YjgK/YiaL family protein
MTRFGRICEERDSRSAETEGRRRFLRTLSAGAVLSLLPGPEGASAGSSGGAEESLLVEGDLKSWRTNPRLQRLAAAFRFLERRDLPQLALGKHVIDDKTYAMIDKSLSQDPKSVEFEAHRKYIDVHYMISGQVTTGFAPITKLQAISPYEEEEDAAIFQVPAAYKKVKLYPGKFAVFFPGAGHMPNCHLDGPHDLHKVVVKVEHDHRPK